MSVKRVALRPADEFLPETIRFTVEEYNEAVNQLNPRLITILEIFEMNGYLIRMGEKPLTYEITKLFERWIAIFKTHR